ncbi:MAG: HAD family hydrolase [Clostridia bacterium]|nr:HAD family hydrolase [Clostridia bacterium]
MIKAVLFDLDGTLLPMDQEVFTKTYFGLLAKHLAPYGYASNDVVQAVLAGTKAMVKNDGIMTNEDAFWKLYGENFGEEKKNDIVIFEKFYNEDFDKVQVSSGFNAKANSAVVKAKELGFRVVLATNPIFPRIATEKRMKWAGLNQADFELFTTYENSSYCKPNLKYYQAILDRLGLKGEECLMVGNDVGEDMIAADLGMKVFLVTDCLINKEGKNISVYPHGNLDDLMRYLECLA